MQSARPTCGGSSTASERGTAANALYACLAFNGNSSGDKGEGARGCREGEEEESWKVSPYGKGGRGRGEQTDTWMTKKTLQSLRGLEENRLESCEGGGGEMQRKTRQ